MTNSTNDYTKGAAWDLWTKYYQDVVKIHGEMGIDAVNKMVTEMLNGTQAMREKLMPVWEEYLKTVRNANGQLPDDIEKINTEIIKRSDRATGKLSELWQNQVSTIVTDFSKGVSDVIFSGQKMSDMLLNIFKEFGKSVTRMFLESVFKPIQDSLQKVVRSIFDATSGTASVYRKTVSQSVQGISQNIMSMTETQSPLLGAMGAAPAFGTGAGSVDWGGFVGPIQGAAKGPFGLPAGGFSEKGIGGPIGGAIAAAGIAAFMDGIKRSGVTGWMETIGGGAAAGFAMGGPLGAAIGALAGVIARGIKIIIGKDVGTAGSMEVTRDFKVDMASDEFKNALASMGISESAAWNIRKDITSSPKMLAEVLGPMAAAQGKTKEFLASLSEVKTAWGTFDFRKEYEFGALTGDWTKLDEVFKAAFKDSQALNQSLPDWEKKLLMAGDAAKKAATDFESLFTRFKDSKTMTQDFADFLEKNKVQLDAVAASSDMFADQLYSAQQAVAKWKESEATIKNLNDMQTGFDSIKTSLDALLGDDFSAFTSLGDITEGLAAKITDLGGDLGKFEEFSRLTKLKTSFVELSNTFRQTGEMTEAFRKTLTDLGVSAEKISEFADLGKSLRELGSAKSGFEGIKSAMMSIAGDDFSKFNSTGEITANLAKQITDLGGNLSTFTEFAQLAKLKNQFVELSQVFMQTGEMTQEFRDVITAAGGNLNDFENESTKMLPKLLASQKGLDALRNSFHTLAMDQETVWEKFARTGEVTQDLRDAVTGLNGDIGQFEQFAKFAGMKKTLNDIYTEFQRTGIITDALRDQFKNLGGDITKLDNLAAMQTVRAKFDKLTQSITSTGKGLAEMREIFKQFNGDLSALDKAEMLPGLVSFKSDIDALRADIQQYIPKTGMGKFMTEGTIDEGMMAQLTAKGADVSKFQKYGSVVQDENRWKIALDTYQKTGEKTKDFIDLASKYGGDAGKAFLWAGEQAKAFAQSFGLSLQTSFEKQWRLAETNDAQREQLLRSWIGKFGGDSYDMLQRLGTDMHQYVSEKIAGATAQWEMYKQQIGANSVITKEMVDFITKYGTGLTVGIPGVGGAATTTQTLTPELIQSLLKGGSIDVLVEAVSKSLGTAKSAAASELNTELGILSTKTGEQIDGIQEALTNALNAVNASITEATYQASKAVQTEIDYMNTGLDGRMQETARALVEITNNMWTGLSENIKNTSTAVTLALTALSTVLDDRIRLKAEEMIAELTKITGSLDTQIGDKLKTLNDSLTTIGNALDLTIKTQAGYLLTELQTISGAVKTRQDDITNAILDAASATKPLPVVVISNTTNEPDTLPENQDLRATAGSRSNSSEATTVEVHLHLEGSTINSTEDLQQTVISAWDAWYKRGGFPYIARTT